VTYFKVRTQHFSGEKKHFSHGSRSQEQGLNTGPPEY
jgi:hypothetical protein